MALAQTATTPPAGNGALRPSDGKALVVEILKGIIWWISSVLVWKSPDIHVAVPISDKDDPDICSLQGQPGVLYMLSPIGSSTISTPLSPAARAMS
jgi:hypothetical protein